MTSPQGFVSRAEIARLAQVKRPAVTNWERRHKDYPRPRLVEGEELFAVEALLEWLDLRRIASNALLPDERPGATFGERFRRNLAGPAAQMPQARSAARREQPATSDLWRTLERLRGTYDIVRYRDLVLSLIYTRAQDRDGWSSVVTGSRSDATALMTFIVNKLGTGDMLSPVAFNVDAKIPAELVEFADVAVGELGGAGAFRALLDRFATLEGRRGGEFYTPPSVVRVLVDALAAETPGEIYDPCCGSGEILLTAALQAPGLTVHGDALNAEALVLAKMNMTLHGIDARLGRQSLDVLSRPDQPSPSYSYIVANPPFGIRNWSQEDPALNRSWLYGPPPRGNADFAWLQFVLERLAPGGRAAVVMPAGAAFRGGRERAIRQAMVADGCIESVIALPSMLFYNTAIGATIWVLRRSPTPRQELLLVDATGLGRLSQRAQRELSEEDHEAIRDVLADWRAGVIPANEALPTAVVTGEELSRSDYDLTPGKYAISEPAARTDDGRQGIETLLRELDRLHEQAARADMAVDQVIGRPQILESPIGELPPGWREVSLADISELTAGPFTRASDDGPVGVVKPRNLEGGPISGIFGGRISGTFDRIDEDTAGKLESYRLAEGDIVCTRTGVIGRHALVTSAHQGWVCGTGLIRIRPRGGVDPQYLSDYLSSPSVLDWLTRNSAGSVLPSINIRVLGTLPVVLPPTEVRETIGRALQALSDKITVHEQIARTTAALRDTLFPLLASGRVMPPE
ncbi:N-6 DNA methylase [Nonomuraea sp. NPDC050680]|uniref:type I restriction-modification system subunit M/S n=1 Tax=Nonomuraea sp. NPDC050680 TaxID=3154630 RepID=UPI0033E3810B